MNQKKRKKLQPKKQPKRKRNRSDVLKEIEALRSLFSINDTVILPHDNRRFKIVHFSGECENMVWLKPVGSKDQYTTISTINHLRHFAKRRKK